MTNITVALVCLKSRFGKPDENLSNMLAWIEQAAGRGADLVCFPEVAVQGYFTDKNLMHRQAETIDGPICNRLIEAAKTHELAISTGMALRDGGKIFNAQVFLGPQGSLGYAPKVHVAPEETRLFEPGDRWPVIDLGFAKVGTVICFDAEFPEAARCLALNGAEIVLMSFATGRCDSCGRPQEPEAWPNQVLCWAPARAYENRVFVLGVNHAGNVADEEGICEASWVEPGALHRWPGYAFAIDPSGEIIGESDRNGNDEGLLIVDLQADSLAHWRVAAGNFLNERRPETYGRILTK